MPIETDIIQIGIPINPDTCIGDSLPILNNSFIKLAKEADRTNNTLVLTALSIQNQLNNHTATLNWHDSRIISLSAPLSGAVVSTKDDLFTTTYNQVVPANKGGAGTLNGILSALGTGTVVQARGTSLSASDNDVVPDAEYVTPTYLIDKLKFYTRKSEWTDDATSQTDELSIIKAAKISTPLQTQWPSSTITNGYILTYDGTVNKGSNTGPLDKWVPRPPAAPSLVGAISCDNLFNTSYVQVVPAHKGGAGYITGILKANGAGLVSQAIPSIDYVVPSDLSEFITGVSLETYATRTWVINTLSSYATKDFMYDWVGTNFYNKTQTYTKQQTDSLLNLKVTNPILNPSTGLLYTTEQLAGSQVPAHSTQSLADGSILTLVSWISAGTTGKSWISRPPASPSLVGAISCDGNFTTSYVQKVPNDKGGAGNLTGILQASGGIVAKAEEGEDYLTKESASWYANYIPVSSLKIDTEARNNSLIKYDDFNKTWRVASPEDEPFAEVNFITGLATQSGGWYSGCAFSERRVIAWGQIDGKGTTDRYKFSKTTATNNINSPSNYLFIPFHSEYETNGNIGNNLHWFDLNANKKAYIKEVIWNWSCAMAWVRNDSKSRDGSSSSSPLGPQDTVWVMGTHRTKNETNAIDNTTGSIGIPGNGGGVNKQTCGFVQVTLPGFPRTKQINIAGHPNNGKWIKEEIIKIQCKCDPGLPPGATGVDVPEGRNKNLTYHNYILWGALTNFGNLYVWGRSKDGCFGTGNLGGGTDLQLDTPTLVRSSQTYDGITTLYASTNFEGKVADFEYTGSEYEGTCLGIITANQYDEAVWPNLFPDTAGSVPHRQLWFAGDNQYYQQGIGTKIGSTAVPASNDYFTRACKKSETGDSNQYGLCNQAQLIANGLVPTTYVDNAKKIVRSQYGGRQANGYIDIDGKLWMCGSNQYGLLGNCGYIGKFTYTNKGKSKTIHRSWGAGFYYQGVSSERIEYYPVMLQEYPFRTSNASGTTFSSSKGPSYDSGSYKAPTYAGKGYFCEARVETWQDFATASTTNPNGISEAIPSAVAAYNKHAVSSVNGPMMPLERFERLNPDYSLNGVDAQTIAVGNGTRNYGRVIFEDAIICGLRAPYLIALGKITYPMDTAWSTSLSSSVPSDLIGKPVNNERYGQYNLYGCGQNDSSHGYLGMNSDTEVVCRLMPAVFKREVKADNNDADDRGDLVLDYVKNAKKIYTSDTNGNVNVDRFTTQIRVKVSSDTYTTKDINHRKYTYLNLGANAYVTDSKVGYICGYKTFNDPPDYDSEAYQYYTRLPIQRVEEMVLGGDLNQHTYQFFRTSPGIVWGMGEGQSNVLGPSNQCYTPTRII